MLKEGDEAAMLRVGVIGAGSMGARHARVVAAHPDAELTVVVDRSAKRAACAARQQSWSTDISSLRRCDAAIIATPTSTHLDIATWLLERGIPVLIEKPAAATMDGVDILLDLAATQAVPLLCGFTERHNAAWLAGLAELTGNPVRLSSTRRSPPVARAEGHVAIDLMIHDIDLAVTLFGCDPRPWAHDSAAHLDPSTAELVIAWPDGARASCVASRAAHSAERTVVVETPHERVVIDLLYGCVVVERNGRRTPVDVLTGNEPLAAQFDQFLALVAGRSDMDFERKVIRVVHDLAFQPALLSDGVPS